MPTEATIRVKITLNSLDNINLLEKIIHEQLTDLGYNVSNANLVSFNEKKLFRKLKHWDVKNHSLYHFMKREHLQIADIGNLAGVSQRTVLRWLFEGVTPLSSNQVTLEKAVNQDGLF